eukprot:TRINITY_DN353_c0_g1_i1.p1 TRINITY_DN353_c0_g1~~TRINITY_DN353_c0_g1_i1.p1  ORF type:complete len:452 (+),score=57.52 TRINITY_DN353_c0_g1_i1:898-2253(+)
MASRHPYKESTGFKNQAELDKHKLFNGFGQESLEHNIHSLKDPEITVENKIQALKFILGHLSGAETKVRTLQYGIIEATKWLIEQNLGAKVDELACMTLRSLSVMPTCVYSIYRHDALPLLIAVLAGRGSASDGPRLEACEAVLQLTRSWHSCWLLLGEEVPPGMLSQAEPGLLEILSPDDMVHRRQLGKQIVECLTNIILDFNSGKYRQEKLLHKALLALANISAQVTGLEMCLMSGTLREVDELLRHFSSTKEWISDTFQPELVLQGVTVAWNICMDPIGKRKPESTHSLPFSLGRLLLAALSRPQEKLLLKAALPGAIAAMYAFEETKSTGVQPLFSAAAEAASFGVSADIYLGEVLMRLMNEANTMLKAVRAGRFECSEENLDKETQSERVTAVVKNVVQAIRLLAEFPGARKQLAQLTGSDKELCIQLYRGTPIAKEMASLCGVVF